MGDGRIKIIVRYVNVSHPYHTFDGGCYCLASSGCIQIQCKIRHFFPHPFSPSQGAIKIHLVDPLAIAPESD